MISNRFFNGSRLMGIVVAICIIISINSYSQQQISVSVDPSAKKAIKGNSELNRFKYFNMAASPSEITKNLNSTQFDKYFIDYGMSIGRKFQLIASEAKWGDGFREDTSRPGFMDTAYFKGKKDPTDTGFDDLKSLLGANCGVAGHDAHDAYPDFMNKYALADAGSDAFPSNNDAAAEMMAYYLKYNFTEFTRPATFEPVNEPHWKYWSDSRFIEFHTKAKQKVNELGVNIKVGGPCYSVGYFYKKNYESMNSMTNFMEATNFGLDFYSFHIYDFMRWDDTAYDFIGSISSGLPEEGVFDALNAYYYNNTGQDFTYVASEHGGYLSDSDNRDYALDMLADKYFPGSGFEHEMKKRSIDNFIMVNSAIANTLTFMNHPHVVKKAVPFILLESSGWNPYYYSSLLVKENFDKNSSIWHEAKLINFYKFFQEVKGHRIVSHCNDTDIQHYAFVDGNTLILLFHNQSNTPGEIDINIADLGISMSNLRIRRTGRTSEFLPFYSEETIESLDSKISIDGQESIAIFAEYSGAIEQKRYVNEEIYYSKETSTQFTGSKIFTVNIQDVSKIDYGYLRIGISRNANLSKGVEIYLNGQKLDVPIEDCAERITSDDTYHTTKIVRVSASLLKEENKVEVNFTDGNSGGVGAVVLRVGIDSERKTVLGLNDVEERAIHLYPNPSNDFIRFLTNIGDQIQVHDLSGKLMHQSSAKSNLSTLSVKSFHQGTYMLKVSNNEGVSDTLFVVSP